MTKIHDLRVPKPDSRVLRSSFTAAQYVQLEARLAHFILKHFSGLFAPFPLPLLTCQLLTS